MISVVFVIIAFLIPPLGIPLGLIGIYSERNRWKEYAFIIALGFASFAYCYEALTASDIVRYFSYIENIKHVSFHRMFTYGSYGSSGLFVFNAVCWIAGKLEDPRIVPAVSIFIVYYVSIYMTCYVSETMQSKRRSLMISLLFVLTALNFYALTNNVRNVLALVLIGYATFRDCYEKKRNVWTYVLYILPIFIHTSAILILALRIVVILSEKLKWIALGLVVLVHPVLVFLHPYTRNMKGRVLSYIGNAINKAYRYYTNSHSSWGLIVQASTSEKLFKILYVTICLILGAIILLMLTHKDLLIPKGVNRVLSMVYYIDLVMILTIPMMMPIYWRFSAAVIAMSGGGLLMCEKYSIKKEYFSMARLICCVMGVCAMLLWVRNLTLYSDYLRMFTSAFISSPVIVLGRDLIHLL